MTAPPSCDGSELTGLSSEVDWLELRADLAGDVPASWFRQRFPAETMYSLRSCAAGGLFDGSNQQREQRLIRAVSHVRDHPVVPNNGQGRVGLFGVTMAEQGISQLVSVDLKGAESLVA